MTNNLEEKSDQIINLFKEIALTGAELAGVVSVTEIMGGVQMNREKIRELCDKILDLTSNLSKI